MTTLKAHRPLLGFGLALASVYTVAVFVAHAVPRVERPDVLAAALTLDLTVIVPLLYYGLLVRLRGWPVITVAPVFLVSLLAASFVVPADHQGTLAILKYLAAPVELGLLGYVGLTVARAARRFRAHDAADDADVIERLQTSLRAALAVPRAADVLAYEVGLIYYALFTWRARPPEAAKHVAFTYHKKSGYGGVVAGMLVAMFIEMIALHLLLWTWKPAFAWGLTALSLYAVLWMLGDLQAVRLRPVRVEKDALVVRIGLRWSVRVPFAVVASVRPATKPLPGRKTPGYLEAVVLGRPTYLVALKEPVVAQGLYGLRKTITTLGLALDDGPAFEAVLKDRYAAWQAAQGRVDR